MNQTEKGEDWRYRGKIRYRSLPGRGPGRSQCEDPCRGLTKQTIGPTRLACLIWTVWIAQLKSLKILHYDNRKWLHWVHVLVCTTCQLYDGIRKEEKKIQVLRVYIITIHKIHIPNWIANNNMFTKSGILSTKWTSNIPTNYLSVSQNRFASRKRLEQSEDPRVYCGRSLRR
jgi:hypothetical protein